MKILDFFHNLISLLKLRFFRKKNCKASFRRNLLSFFSIKTDYGKSSLLGYVVLLAPLILYSHIEEPKVVSGQADFNQISPTHLEITTQNSTIIEYKQFNIPENHKVKIIQPSAKSKVLNRVRGANPSQILGDLESNGKVFLINPNGIFFGPNCQVNTGSLIASTLDIADEDFKKGIFRFKLSGKAKDSQILNQGALTANLEGEIALIAPRIINEGVISAAVGKVGYFAAPIVTLDLTGDHLVNFAVEGELEEGIIKHLGKTRAEEGNVYMRLSAVKQVIENVVNKDGLTPGNFLVKDNGVVRIVSHSEILAKNASIKGRNIDVSGDMNVSHTVNLEASDICLLNQGIESSFVAVEAQTTHMKAGLQALEGMTFKGAVLVESPKVALKAEGKSGVIFQDSIMLGKDLKELKISAPTGVVSLGTVAFKEEKGVVNRACVDIYGKVIEVGGSIKTNAPMTFNGETHLSNNIACRGNNLVFNGPVIVGGHGFIKLSTFASNKSNKGDIVFNGPLDGKDCYRNLTISTGEGSTKFKGPVGKEMPLDALEIISKSVEFYNDIGGEKSGILKKLYISAIDFVNLYGKIYNTGEQLWKGNCFYIHKPTQFISNSQPIAFISTRPGFEKNGVINLKENTSLHINTGGSPLNFSSIQAEKGSPIFLTSGDLSLGGIFGDSSPLNVQASKVTLNGNISVNSLQVEAEGDIISSLSSYKIVSKGDVYLNSKRGSIGYLEDDIDLSKNRLYVKSDQKIYVGSPKTVNLEGVSIDKVLNPIPGNMPLAMFFNGVESYQFMGEFFVDLEELLSSLAPHLSSKKQGDYVDTTIVNPRPAPLYYTQTK